ncbi:MAG: Xaa-Pro peptidase family protein [Sulfolobales archaeon]
MVEAEVLSHRLYKLQSKLKALSIDCAMIRTLSDYRYLLGLKWLRPAVLIPAEGVPTVFIANGEEEGFSERCIIKDLNVVTYFDGSDLMLKVTSAIKSLNAKKVGMVFSVERDSYSLLYELFRRANKNVEVVDIGPLIAELRSLKDDYEIGKIRLAGNVASEVLEKALNAVEEGVSETDIAAEAYYKAFKLGCEEPHIYVNSGPHPKVHSEPSKDIKIKSGVLVTIVVAADRDGYYANTSATTYVGSSRPETLSNALRCAKDVYERAYELSRPGIKFIDVMKDLDEIYKRYGLLGHRLIGYTHGVGLQPEEFPITTIVAAHRSKDIEERMVLAFVHSPLMLPGYGSIKYEDTFIVSDKGLERVTKANDFLNQF